MRALPVLLTSTLLASGCSPDVEVTQARLALTLPVSAECQPPDGVGRLEVVAAGDFPSTNDTVDVQSLDEPMILPIRKFPFETRVLKVSLRVEDTPFVAGALHTRADQDTRDTLLLLPLGRSCANPDATEVRLVPGAALAPLPGGGYLIAGGSDAEGNGRRRLVVVPADEALASVDLELATRRIGASATSVGDRVVIAGGAEFEGSAAEETFEIYDAAAGEVTPGVEPLCSTGVCQRRDHGATVVADGRVLLVGGVTGPGAEPLTSTVAIDPVTAALDESVAALGTGRRLPFVATLDDGTVVVAGGLAQDGSFVASVEILPPGSGAFREVASLPVRPDAAFVVLSGGRLVVVGGRGEGETAATVIRIGADGTATSEDVVIRGLDRDGLVPLANAHAVALADERILLVGVDDAAEGRSFRVDVGRGLAEERSAPARPTDALVACADGAIAELGAEGASYRRELLRTRFDNPPDTLFSMDAEWLALDVASSYADDREGLEALVDGAPVRVAGLAFSDVRVSPTVEGPYRLVLEGESETSTIEVGERVSVDGCELPRGERDTVELVRRGDTITDGNEERECPLTGLEGPVRISLHLDAGSRFRAIAIARVNLGT